MDAGPQGSGGFRSRWLPLPCRHNDYVQPVGTPPSTRCVGRPRGLPSRALGSGEWTEGATVGLLPIWRRVTYMHGHASGPTTGKAGAGYYSSALYTATHTWPSSDTATT